MSSRTCWTHGREKAPLQAMIPSVCNWCRMSSTSNSSSVVVSPAMLRGYARTPYLTPRPAERSRTAGPRSHSLRFVINRRPSRARHVCLARVRRAALVPYPQRVGDVETLLDQLPLQHLVGGGLGEGRGDAHEPGPLLRAEVGL